MLTSILRITEPIPGMLVLIVMQFSWWWFQIGSWNSTILTFVTECLTREMYIFDLGVVCTRLSRGKQDMLALFLFVLICASLMTRYLLKIASKADSVFLGIGIRTSALRFCREKPFFLWNRASFCKPCCNRCVSYRRMMTYYISRLKTSGYLVRFMQAYACHLENKRWDVLFCPPSIVS